MRSTFERARFHSPVTLRRPGHQRAVEAFAHRRHLLFHRMLSPSQHLA
jgi:hypothetical protein